MFRIRYALMEEAVGDGGASGGAGNGNAGAGSAAAVGAGAAGAGGAAAGSGDAGGAGSALAGGAGEAGAAGAGAEWLSEKFQVKKEDGSVDIEASARKMADSNRALEARMKEQGMPPETADGYTATVPETLKDKINLEEDAFFKETRDSLHGLGLTQKQFDGVMEKYWQIAPALVGAGNAMTAEKCTADLNALWTDPSARTANFKHALAATTTISNVAGVKMEDLDAAGLTNNPTFIRLMAAIGPEFSEDKTEAGSGTVLASEGSIKELMMSDAYKNDKDPKHAETVAKVRAYHNRQHGAHPVV